jgi:uncharacterized protein (DUF4213/DUF364 family)
MVDREHDGLPKNIISPAQPGNEIAIGRADVVFLSTSTIVDNSFSRLLHAARNARLIGVFGLGGSLIPDAFFDAGIDFYASYRITDPVEFVNGMKNDHDMEYSMGYTQKQYLMMRKQAGDQAFPVSGSPLRDPTGVREDQPGRSSGN